MALFKSLRGKRENLPSTKTDGYAYFCTDDGTFWIDYKDDSDVVQRKQINAKDAETLMGCSISQAVNNSESEIPISSAIFNALAEKVPIARKVNGKALNTDIELSAEDVGAISYNEAQSLTDEQKTQARENIGAGTSSFSGSYNDLTNKPTIPSAYTLPVATASALGGVKSGGDISVASDGTVTVTKESLPTYSTADNGKVLMIVNGVPTWVTLNLTMDSDGYLKI